MIAISALCGRWQGAEEVYVPCPFCQGEMSDDEDAQCEECSGAGEIRCIGRGRWAEHISGESPEEVYLEARCILWGLERQWTPSEIAQEPAPWVASFLLLEAIAGELLEEGRKRARARRGIDG